MISTMTAFTNISTMYFSLDLNQQVFISTWLINNFSQQVQIRPDQRYKRRLEYFSTGVDFPGATHCEELPYMFDVRSRMFYQN